MGYMRSRSTLLVMDVQVELKTEIFWCKLKVLLLCGFFVFFFYHCFMQYRFGDADSDCFMGRSLCQGLSFNGQVQLSWIGINHGRI